jgi:PDZ domain-containing protein
VSDLIDVAEGTESYPPAGALLLTTVSLGETRAIEAFIGWLDPDVDVVRREQIVPPDTSGDEFRRFNQLLMEDSQLTAVVVALRRIGHNISERGDGGLIAGVVPEYPADGHLQPGEVIRSVDGEPTPLSQDVVAAIRQHEPGETVRLDVSASATDAATHPVEIRLAAHPEGGGAFLGVEVRTANRDFDLPFEVKIDAGTIGGPSAGLAFTLGVIDVLTPGELTGGRPIAVTGTIDLDNAVGAVGGVSQKAAAVSDAGIEVFLVPAGEAPAARARVGDTVRIVPVRTLEDALAALRDLGGDVSALGLPEKAAS